MKNNLSSFVCYSTLGLNDSDVNGEVDYPRVEGLLGSSFDLKITDNSTVKKF